MEEIAGIASTANMKWSAGSIAAIENGNFKPTIENIIRIGSALSTATNKPVTLTDLLQTNNPINLTDELSATTAEIVEILSGPFPQKLNSGPSYGELRIAEKVGMTWEQLREQSVSKWGKGFEQHRDELAGENATPQKRGRVTRKLIEELVGDV